jgi:hypothetical protein
MTFKSTLDVSPTWSTNKDIYNSSTVIIWYAIKTTLLEFIYLFSGQHCHDIAEIQLKLVLNTNQSINLLDILS